MLTSADRRVARLVTADDQPMWDDRSAADDSPRRPGESEAEHVHRTIADIRRRLDAHRDPRPGARPAVAHSEPVTTAPTAEPTRP